MDHKNKTIKEYMDTLGDLADMRDKLGTEFTTKVLPQIEEIHTALLNIGNDLQLYKHQGNASSEGTLKQKLPPETREWVEKKLNAINREMNRMVAELN